MVVRARGHGLRGGAPALKRRTGIGELQVGNGQTLYSPSERSDLFAFGLDREFGDGLNARLKAYDREISDQQPRFIGLQQVKFPRL